MASRKKQKDRKRKAIFALIFLLTLALLSSIYCLAVHQHIVHEKTRYGYIAANEAGHINTLIDCIMVRTNILKALVQNHHGTTEFFDEVAASIYDSVVQETGVTLKNVAIAPGGVVSHVYPPEGNEVLIGFDFMDLSRQGNEEAREAYVKGDTVLTKPFPLVQGGIGIAGRTPVIVEEDGGPKLWGLVTVTIDYDRLIDALMLKHLETMGIDYMLSFIDGDGTAHPMSFIGALEDDAVRKRFVVRNLTWELALRPKEGWSSPWQHVVAGVLFVLLAGFTAKFVDVVIRLRESNRVLRRMIGKFFDMLFRLRESNEALKNMSEHDAMTGLWNRRAYAAAIDAFTRNPPGDCCVMMADINGLKEVNDTSGHKAGDELILGATECLRHAFGKAAIYRLGGDEFCVIAKKPPEEMENDIAVFQRLIGEWRGSDAGRLSVSYGMANSRDHQDFTALVRDADRKMYESKSNYYRMSGKDRRK